MGGRAGGGARGGGGGPRDFSRMQFLRGVPDSMVRGELIKTLQDYEQEFGIGNVKITLANLEGDVGGDTTISSDGKITIRLNKGLLSGSYSDVSRKVIGQQISGRIVDTWHPVRHVLAHELGHAVWFKGYSSKNASTARTEAAKAYKKFLSDNGATGWGSYSKSKYTEWVAEGVAKHMYGTKDSHTTTILGIIKKNK